MHTNNMIIKIVSDDIYYWKIGLMMSLPVLYLRKMEIDEKMYISLKRPGCWRSSYHYYSKFGSEHLKMRLGTWLIAIALKKPTYNFPWKQAKEDNSKRTFLMIVNKLSVHHVVYVHRMNKFLKWTFVFSASQGYSLSKSVFSFCVFIRWSPTCNQKL